MSRYNRTNCAVAHTVLGVWLHGCVYAVSRDRWIHTVRHTQARKRGFQIKLLVQQRWEELAVCQRMHNNQITHWAKLARANAVASISCCAHSIATARKPSNLRPHRPNRPVDTTLSGVQESLCCFATLAFLYKRIGVYSLQFTVYASR